MFAVVAQVSVGSASVYSVRDAVNVAFAFRYVVMPLVCVSPEKSSRPVDGDDKR
jgi:hypothetical protein